MDLRDLFQFELALRCRSSSELRRGVEAVGDMRRANLPIVIEPLHIPFQFEFEGPCYSSPLQRGKVFILGLKPKVWALRRSTGRPARGRCQRAPSTPLSLRCSPCRWLGGAAIDSEGTLTGPSGQRVASNWESPTTDVCRLGISTICPGLRLYGSPLHTSSL